ncbi:MAG TPA: spore coat protein [Clostridiaceae bacterium]|jgi:spore coat protein F|nr:spore coat protein [Clostridiaceae bacterium]
MKNITDKEIVNVLLNQHKLSASSLTTLVLESANQNLRNDATNILNKTFKHQKQIFDIMTQKGWYQVQSASQQQISQAQQEMGGTQQAFTM